MPTDTAVSKFRTILDALNSTDRLFLTFWGLLSLTTIIFSARVPFWHLLVAVNLIAAAAVCFLASVARAGPGLTRVMHDWAALPMVLFTFKLLYFLISPIHQGRDYDELLIAVDRAIFRTDPTVWLSRFSAPAVTELLQIAYSLFYVLFIVAGVELYRKKQGSLVEDFRFLMVYGFLISYIGYFFLPAVGPRFTLHDFSAIDHELPGLLFTPALRLFVNIGESIPPGVTESVAMALAQRDVFPSGHTMMTVMLIVYSYRHRLRVRRLVLATGTLLIFATVYLRYHYVVDLLAGALLAFFCLRTAHAVQRRFEGRV